jgi:hypothetical protein
MNPADRTIDKQRSTGVACTEHILPLRTPAGRSFAPLPNGGLMGTPPEPSTQVAHERAVELWSPSLRRWVHGFSLVGRDDGGLVIRRRSDGALLPVTFAEDDVRPSASG